ncbi:hypothetical protein BaRGS_00018014 [Batillaria attramentaria]|uniref:Uncharacterized protein n=1 Tax=Batillaria attramentaria TaxID=370345 RepID=A0ABD0KUE6_9CAEN
MSKRGLLMLSNVHPYPFHKLLGTCRLLLGHQPLLALAVRPVDKLIPAPSSCQYQPKGCQEPLTVSNLPEKAVSNAAPDWRRKGAAGPLLGSAAKGLICTGGMDVLETNGSSAEGRVEQGSRRMGGGSSRFAHQVSDSNRLPMPSFRHWGNVGPTPGQCQPDRRGAGWSPPEKPAYLRKIAVRTRWTSCRA